MANPNLTVPDEPDLFLLFLLRCALTAPGASSSPTAGRILARLLVVGAIEGGDELVTPYLVPVPGEDASFEVRAYRPGNLEPTEVRAGLGAAAALRIALRAARDGDDGLEVVSHTRAGLERCVLVRDSTGDFEFRFASGETLTGEPEECAAARRAWAVTLADWRAWVAAGHPETGLGRSRPEGIGLVPAESPSGGAPAVHPESPPAGAPEVNADTPRGSDSEWVPDDDRWRTPGATDTASENEFDLLAGSLEPPGRVSRRGWWKPKARDTDEGNGGAEGRGPAPGATGPGATGPGATGPGATGPGATGPGDAGPGTGPGATPGEAALIDGPQSEGGHAEGGGRGGEPPASPLGATTIESYVDASEESPMSFEIEHDAAPAAGDPDTLPPSPQSRPLSIPAELVAVMSPGTEAVIGAIQESLADLTVKADVSQDLIRQALTTDRDLVEPLARRLSIRLAESLGGPDVRDFIDAVLPLIPRPGEVAEAVTSDVTALLSEVVLRRRPGELSGGIEGLAIISAIEQLQVRLDGMSDQLRKSTGVLLSIDERMEVSDRRTAAAERIGASIEQEIQRLAQRIDEQVEALAASAGGGSELADGVARLTRKLRQSVAQLDRTLVRLDDVVEHPVVGSARPLGARSGAGGEKH